MCCLLGTMAISQDRWDLKKCVQYALENNISIKQADIDARTAKLTYDQSKWARFGQANFGTQLGLNLGRSIDPTTNLFSNTQQLYQGISLQYTANLFNWFSLRRQIEANAYMYEAQKVNIDKIKNDVTLNVAAAYLQALLAREQVKVSQTKLDLTKEQLFNTQRLVDAGSVPELNAAELEAQFATDTATLIGAKSTFEQNVLQLKATLNLDAAYPFDLDTPPVESIPVDPISEMQPDIVYAMAEKSFPQQKLNELRISAAKKNVQSVRAQLYPTFSAFGSLGDNFANDLRASNVMYTYQGTQLYVNDPAFPGGKNFVFSPVPIVTKTPQPFGDVFKGYWPQLDNNFRQSVGLQLSVPIFNGNTVRTNYEKAKLTVQTADLQKQNDLLTLKQNIYQAYYSAVAALEKFEANKKAVTTAERSFDLSSKRYNIGMQNSIDYLTNQNNLYTARINVLYAQYDYVFKMKVLEFYKGLGVKL